jgi:hypothetical protein
MNSSEARSVCTSGTQTRTKSAAHISASVTYYSYATRTPRPTGRYMYIYPGCGGEVRRRLTSPYPGLKNLTPTGYQGRWRLYRVLHTRYPRITPSQTPTSHSPRLQLVSWPTAILIVACGIAVGRCDNSLRLAKGHIHPVLNVDYGLRPNSLNNDQLPGPSLSLDPGYDD